MLWIGNLGRSIGTLAKRSSFTPSFFDDFDRADENLEASVRWTRSGGATAQMGVRTNQLAVLGTTQTFYYTDTTSPNAFVNCTIRGIPATAGPVVACRSISDINWVGFRWNATQFQLQKCIASSFTTLATVSQAPVLGDVVRVVTSGVNISAYVNGILVVGPVAIDAASLDAATRAGVVARVSTQNPWIDNFSCGKL